MIKINISQLNYILDHTPADQNIMLAGSHGIGKSEILTAYFSAKGIKVIPLFLGQMSDPGDIIGLPFRNDKTGRTEFMPPYWFPVDGKPVVLFLDELNRARPEVLQTIMDLTLNRTLANRSLPKGSMVISAVNIGEEYLLTEMDPALVSRFNVYEFSPTVSEWIKWARQTGVDMRVIDFIESEPIWLDGEKSPAGSVETIEKNPDRRAWKRVSDLITGTDKIDSLMQKMISGVVGEKAGKAFSAYQAKPSETSSFKASAVLCDFESYRTELQKSRPHVLAVLNKDIFKYLSGKPETAAAGGLKEYIRMLTKEGRAEVMADFINLFSDKKNHSAVSFIGKECYEVVLTMQKFISRI